jgi:UDP-N-acetylmuramyl pentapeptide phosphotransferase/UDP-N-acetylglucosamine-1-phosphate transferase/glycosyltransferase involved in cell wall biosynthesis
MYLLTSALATVAALMLTPLVARMARALGLVDQPNARTVHHSPTPRVGGIAIVLATVLAACAIAPFAGLRLGIATNLPVFGLILAATGIFIVGVLDDLFSVSSKIKLVAIIGGASVVWGMGGRIETLSLGDGVAIHIGIFSWPLTVLFIAAITTGLNFIDGLDGLAAGISAIALIATTVISAERGQPALALLCTAMFGSLLGFLVFNFHPARIFMGDCGSMFLGFVLGSCGVVIASSTQSAHSFVAFTLALGVPIADLGLTILRRRVLQRRSIFSAERGHIHHRLLDRGLTQKQVVLRLYAATALVASVGMMAMLERKALLISVTACGIGLLAVLFHRAGSFHIGDLWCAFWRNFSLARDAKCHLRSFEEMQLRFRNVNTFDTWWEEVCRAIGLLDFESMVLPMENRDGTMRHLRWNRDIQHDELDRPRIAPIAAVIPISQRRVGPPLSAQVQLAVRDSLEDAGRRMTLFARLIEENSLARLPYDVISTRETPLASKTGSHSPACTNGCEGACSGKCAAADISVLMSKLPDGLPAMIHAREDHPQERGISMLDPTLRVAVVHDFLYTYAGAERVLEQILKIFPQADVFSLFDFLPAKDRGFIGGKKVTSSFIQWLPMARKRHRHYLPFMPLAIEQLDVSAFDLIVSSSYVTAKGIITRPDQLHICYCHSPARFAWDLQHQYLSESGMTRGFKSFLARTILHYIRNWDSRTANGVDAFVTNSNFVGRRIEKVYRRKATTIYPPVDTERYMLHTEKDDFYLTVSRMVPYKKIDLIVDAFSRMPNRRLIVIGDGPDAAKIKARAGANVRLMGFQPFEVLRHYMQRAKAFVFAAEEDFGIVPVEAQACGTPVIAFGRGGVTESVVPGVTGFFFDEQTPQSLIAAVEEFEASAPLDPVSIRRNALRFSISRFCDEFSRFAQREIQHFQARRRTTSAEPFPGPLGIDIPLSNGVVVLAPEPRNGNGNGNGHGNGHGHGKHAAHS